MAENSIPAAAQTTSKWLAAPLLFPLGYSSAQAAESQNPQQLLIWLAVYAVNAVVYVLSAWLQKRLQ